MLKLILWLSSVAIFDFPLQTVQSLLCREWKVNYFEENGSKVTPEDNEANDRIIIHANGTAEVIESGELQDALWEYDVATKKLNFINRVTKESTLMKVVQLNKAELVLEMNQDGERSVIHLTPVK